MQIAILMANTDESAFAQRHPKDGEKFRDLMALARPGWTYPLFAVKDGMFPSDLDAIDGAIITGSPASVRDSTPWMIRLEALVREMEARQQPIFGACFGHQIVAQALGGRVIGNPGGWVKGVVAVAYGDKTLDAFASHTEQVFTLPPGAEVIATHPSCEIAAFALYHHIETTQYHPEMTTEFFSALLDEYARALPGDVVRSARASLRKAPDRNMWAERIATFFERAASQAKRTSTDPKRP